MQIEVQRCLVESAVAVNCLQVKPITGGHTQHGVVSAQDIKEGIVQRP